MRVLLAVIREVELVSDESWWSENAGSILLAVAAASAACLAAYVANRNHKRQLAHDRDIQNQDHIREVIDAADVSLTDAHSALNEYVFSGGGSEDWRNDLYCEAQGKINAISNLTHRLRVRLGEDSEIAMTHDVICDALQDVLDDELKRRGGNGGSESSGLTRDDEVEVARWAPVKAGFLEFRKECYAWFNSQPEQSFRQRIRTKRSVWAARIRAVR